MDEKIKKLQVKIEKESLIINKLFEEIQKEIVGQSDLIKKLVVAVLTNGHVLLEGVPGLAKTKTILTLAKACGVDFQRIQFTPDLLPSDLIGNKIFDQKSSKFSVKKGPVFANFILADEINRSPAKVQSALLEAMQERQVTISEETFDLPNPFFVLATQNPIEQEGTYPLPEAQVDRFLLKVNVGYPNEQEEIQIMNINEKSDNKKISKVLTSENIIGLQKLVEEVYIDEKIKEYIRDIVFATRNDNKGVIAYGASPRASIALVKTSKVMAFLDGRGYVIPEDIKAIGMDVLRHRVIPTYEAEAEGLTSEMLVSEVMNSVKVP